MTKVDLSNAFDVLDFPYMSNEYKHIIFISLKIRKC